MRVGTVREIKNHEYRVGLTPESARELVAHGHEVWVEAVASARPMRIMPVPARRSSPMRRRCSPGAK